MNKNIYMSKELFLEVMSSIKQQAEIDNKCSEAFQTILSNDHVTSYNNSLLLNMLIKLLKIYCNDYEDSDKSWIEYFIWELDFGKKYKEGWVVKENNINIDMSTEEKLYDFLKNRRK